MNKRLLQRTRLGPDDTYKVLITISFFSIVGDLVLLFTLGRYTLKLRTWLLFEADDDWGTDGRWLPGNWRAIFRQTQEDE